MSRGKYLIRKEIGQGCALQQAQQPGVVGLFLLLFQQFGLVPSRIHSGEVTGRQLFTF